MDSANDGLFDRPAWPKPGDGFESVLSGSVGDGEDPRRVVRLESPWWSDRAYRYVLGYGEAAQILFRHASESPYGEEALVYPILYLFRHHVELSLKYAVELASALYDCDVPVRPVHNLQTLWQDATKCLKAGGKLRGRERDDWRAVGRCLRQLNTMDAESQAVRYSVDKAGDEQPLRSPLGRGREPVTHVNLTALAELMSKIANFLDGLLAMLGAEADVKAEMEAEAASYAGDRY